MLRILVAFAFVVGVVSPAFAAHCPRDVKRIDQALAKAQGLSSAQISKIKGLRDKGEAQHKSGDHGGSQVSLHKALNMLGIKPH
jgi:hypothetical protein